MSLKGQILDGTGGGFLAKVTLDHALKVTPTTIKVSDLTEEELIRRRYFNEFLKESGGSDDLSVDGSVTEVEFDIQTIEGFVIFVSQLRFVYHDTNMDMGGGAAGKFGSTDLVNPLTNGLKLTVQQGGGLTEVFSLPVQAMADHLNYSKEFLNITGAFGAGIDYLSFDINFIEPVPLTVPITDRVFVTIRDDLTNMSFFKIIATGVKEAL